MISGIICRKLTPERKTGFIAERKGFLNPGALTPAERNSLIREKPAYGNIICRCETVSEGEIIDAIRRPVGARSLDASNAVSVPAWGAARLVSVCRKYGNPFAGAGCTRRRNHKIRKKFSYYRRNEYRW